MLRLTLAARLSFSLGLLSLGAVYVCHLALQDIYHGEADTTTEWAAVQICFAIILVFQIPALPTLWQILRRKHDAA